MNFAAVTPHHRRSIRLKGYDYTAEGGYFITIVTSERKNLFGEIINGEMQPNPLGEIAREEWFRSAVIRPYIELFADEFVVMPNHIHGIIWLVGRGTARRAPTDGIPMVEQFGKPVTASIPTIVRAYKSAVTKRINVLRNTPSSLVWQRNYFEHIITTDREYDSIAEYIFANPQNWGVDREKSTGQTFNP